MRRGIYRAAFAMRCGRLMWCWFGRRAVLREYDGEPDPVQRAVAQVPTGVCHDAVQRLHGPGDPPATAARRLRRRLHRLLLDDGSRPRECQPHVGRRRHVRRRDGRLHADQAPRRRSPARRVRVAASVHVRDRRSAVPQRARHHRCRRPRGASTSTPARVRRRRTVASAAARWARAGIALSTDQRRDTPSWWRRLNSDGRRGGIEHQIYTVQSAVLRGVVLKKKWGTPETRLREQILNNLGLHTRTLIQVRKIATAALWSCPAIQLLVFECL